MTKLTLEQIDKLTFDMVWITANQTDEFDDILRRPIKNLEAVRQAFKEYQTRFIHAVKTNPSGSINGQLTQKFISDIRYAGEDVEHIYLWLKSMDDHKSIKDGKPQGTSALCDNWSIYFRRIFQKSYRPVDNLKIIELIETYYQAVFLPDEEFTKKRKIAEKKWLSGQQYRSPYDEFLWQNYYKNVVVDPTIMFFRYVHNIYFRGWWRQYIDFLTADEKEIMYHDLVNFMPSYELDGVDWNYVSPIDEAIDLDNIPDFEKYAAPKE